MADQTQAVAIVISLRLDLLGGKLSRFEDLLFVVVFEVFG